MGCLSVLVCVYEWLSSSPMALIVAHRVHLYVHQTLILVLGRTMKYILKEQSRAALKKQSF